jgi:4-hydroxyproline epimerase
MTAFPFPPSVDVVDSHTEGEPTRVVVSGWPDFRAAGMEGRRTELAERFDALRSGVVREPRGHEAVVGAVLTPPVAPGSLAGVVFFNNVGPLRMCGHGLIGVVRTLQFLGRIGPGRVVVDTPAGPVGATLADDGLVEIENVPSRLLHRDVAVVVPGIGRVVGDVAYGGNWFFLAHLPGTPVRFAHRAALLAATIAIKDALAASNVRGDGGEEIDHVEVFGPPERPDADAKNFVLCPGGEYDRSPCGTGTSAKMAALVARGKLAVGAPWRQESITGGLFVGRVERRGDALVPFVAGRAFVTGRATLLFDPADPFRAGFD